LLLAYVLVLQQQTVEVISMPPSACGGAVYLKNAMKRICLCFWLYVLCYNVYSQNNHQYIKNQIIVPLKTIHGDSSWTKELLYADYHVIFNQPGDFIVPPGYKNYRTAAIILNPAQRHFENFHHGKMSADKFDRLLKLYNIDTTILYKGELHGNTINIFTAIDPVNKYVIIDANNNSSFLDDSLYTFPLKNRKPDKPQVNVLITKYNGKKMTTFSVPVRINPFDYGDEQTELGRSLEISLIAASMRLGQVKVNNKIYQIGLNNRTFGTTWSNNTDYWVQVKAVPLNKNDINGYIYFPYYDIDIGGYMYHVEKLTDSALILKFIKKRDNDGGSLYSTAPAIEMPDIMTNKLFRLDIHSGKYTIIDFWGSWCGPCIEALPLLINAHNKYVNNVNFVSVALDYEENVPKLKSLITENKLTWPQVWVDRHKIEGSVVFDYKVNSYPTTILLNKEGTIIYRGIGAEGLENVLKIIENKSVEN